MTLVATAYAVAIPLDPGRVVLTSAAVLTGQLSIGWSNDLLDARRDAAVARTDKPLATGALSARTARVACGVAVVATVALSLATGLVAGLVHLLAVAIGWGYNLGLKSTVLSWLPFALSFGLLPVFLTLAEPGAGLPPAWVPAAAALLGVGAHLVNVLPDLDDDAATGVRGLAHRVGERPARLLAVAALLAASLVLVLGSRGTVPPVAGLVVLATTVGLATVAVVADGRTPFRAAIGIAVVDVMVLVLAR